MKVEEILTLKGISFLVSIIGILFIVWGIITSLTPLTFSTSIEFYYIFIVGFMIFIMGMMVSVISKQTNKLRFKHKDWNENCKEPLSLVFHGGYYNKCLSCGYDSRGKTYIKNDRR